MREDLCSIPIHDVFLPKEGCPFCRMRETLEDRLAAYITGAAMMEPSVRLETNRLGFCARHFERVLAKGSKLSVALILESLLHQVGEEVFPGGKYVPKKTAAAVAYRESHCFLCENLDGHMAHLMRNTVALWRSDGEFRQLYREQPVLCLPHYGQALAAAQTLPKRELAAFQEDTQRLAWASLDRLSQQVTQFTKMFDYRNAGGDFGDSRDAAERAVAWLTGREPVVQEKADEKNRAF